MIKYTIKFQETDIDVSNISKQEVKEEEEEEEEKDDEDLEEEDHEEEEEEEEEDQDHDRGKTVQTEEMKPEEPGEEETEEPEVQRKNRRSFELPAGFTVLHMGTKKRTWKEYLSPDGINYLGGDLTFLYPNISGKRYRSLVAIQRELAQAGSDNENNLEDPMKI